MTRHLSGAGGAARRPCAVTALGLEAGEFAALTSAESAVRSGGLGTEREVLRLCRYNFEFFKKGNVALWVMSLGSLFADH